MASIAVPRLGARASGAGDNRKAPLAVEPLTRKESELLSVLKESAGQCLSRGFLLRRVWGYHEDTRTRTLDVHIQRLRRKLGPEGGSRILTVLHSGYMWCPDKEALTQDEPGLEV